jgi:hypothetical protein
MEKWGMTETEQQIAKNFKQLALGLNEIEDKPDAAKQSMLKEMTSIMQECKRCLMTVPFIVLMPLTRLM